MSASTRTYYTSPAGTIAVDSLTKQILVVRNRLLMLPKFGGEVEPVTATQGSYRPETDYSGTTHTGCAVVDTTPYNWKNRLILGDLLGMTTCHRLRSEGNWPEHNHEMTRGMGCAAASLKAQIEEVKKGGDGLRGNRPDRDRALRSLLWPLAVYQGDTGRKRTRVAASAFAQPSIRAPKVRVVPTGGRVLVLMQVNVNGHFWSVTDQGDFMASGNLV